MRKIILLIMCGALISGGLYVALFELLYSRVIWLRFLFAGGFMASIGGYLIWTDFIAPSLGIQTWED